MEWKVDQTQLIGAVCRNIGLKATAKHSRSEATVAKKVYSDI